MESELSGLEAKLDGLVKQHVRLRAENHDLRQQVASRTDECARLKARLEQARARIEGLLKQLPDEPAQKAA